MEEGVTTKETSLHIMKIILIIQYLNLREDISEMED